MFLLGKKLINLLGWQQKILALKYVFVCVVFSFVEAVSLAYIVPFLSLLSGQESGLNAYLMEYLLQVLNYDVSNKSLIILSGIFLIFLMILKFILHIVVNYLGSEIPYGVLQGPRIPSK